MIISENVYVPLIYYSHIGALLPSLLIAFFVFYKNPRNLSTRIFFCSMSLFSVWIFCNLVIWATEFPERTMFYWTILNTVEPIIYFTTFYFIYTFIYKKNLSLLKVFLLTLPLYPTLILAQSTFMLIGYNLSNCDRNAYEGILASYGYTIEIFYVLGIIGIWIFSFLKHTKNKDEKTKDLIVTIGGLLFLISFSLGNIVEVFTENWEIGLYGLFGAPIFVALLAYTIVRYNAFNTRLIGTQAIVFALFILVFSLLFVQEISSARVVISSTLVVLVFVGYLLIKSVKKEVQQREKIELLAKQLETANVRLKGLDKMKSEFVSVASHQLRGPLTSIRGYASMLAEGSYGKLPQKASEVLEKIADSAKFMALSVEDYLNVSRIEAGNMKYEMADFNLKELVEKVVDELRPIAMKKGLVMVFRSDCNGSCMTHADIGKSRQIIMNLLDNSMKYTPKGTITVVVHDDTKKKKLFVSIQDTGVGMSKETLEELFDKFVRAKNANQINVTGTGLGLYVARKMIIEMNGCVWAESEGEGKGSTFIVEFPLLPGKAMR